MGHEQRLAGFFVAYPDLRFEINKLVAQGDWFAWLLTTHGTHLGQTPTMPLLAPTGKQMTGQAYAFLRIEDGKLAEYWGGPDTWITLQQLGAVVSIPTSP